MPADKTPEPSVEVPPVQVEVLRVSAIRELADTFDLTAVIEPNRIVRVAAEVSARIEKMGSRSRRIEWRGRVLPEGAPIDEGEPIRVGDAIVLLNQELLQARHAQANAQFEFDDIEYRRILNLYERATASKSELDDKRSRREISKAVLKEAAEALERTTVVAPISGILNKLPMEVGEYATPGSCVAEIVDIDVAKVVVDVPERDVHYLRADDTAEIFSSIPDQPPLRGRITYISELADERTRTTRVEITVDNRDRALRSGQIVRARLTRRILQGVIMIPLASVIPLEHGKAVYVVGPGDTAQRRDVSLGFLKGRSVRVLAGLDPGDRLIVSGHRYVGPGQPVTVVKEQ
jgi:membrane fusion protein (multidrug efflux system)